MHRPAPPIGRGPLTAPSGKNNFFKWRLPFYRRGINQYNNQKHSFMKFAKLSIFALTLGILAASCNGGGGEAKKTDSTSAAPAMAPAAPAAAPAPAADTTKKADTAAKAAAPAEKK
jgi:hypothetical protein